MCDAIIAYVDGTDKTWIKNYNKFVKNPLENVESRFRSYDVLDIQVKLIRKFMPFIDKIFIVVSNLSQLDHVIDELKKLDKVFIVTHEEIIPKRYLPCFNSCTIEMYLHNIKKLDEKFLYFNDDIFPINETKESDFFNGGNICMKPGLKYFDEEICSAYEHNVVNSTKLLYKDTKIYGKYNAIKPVHSVMPMFKSINERVWLEYHNEIEKSLTRTRHRKNVNAYIFLNYLYQKKKYTSKQVECSYFSIFNNFEDINKSIKKSKVICINDKSEYYINFDEWKKELRKFLECVLEDKEYYIEPIQENKIVKLPNLINKENNLDIIRYCKNHNINKNYKDGFSICLTAYKTDKYIEECLDSIQEQTYFIDHKNYEIILAIDHCHDTLEKIKSIMNKYENLVIIMLNENVGTYVASNTAMALAKYKWLIRFDTDDTMKPYMVETIADNLDNCDIIQYKLESFSTDGTKFKPFLDFVNGSIAFKKEVFDIYGGYRDWVCSADYEMLVRLSFLSIKQIDKQLLNYRRTLNCLTKNEKTNGKSILRKQYNEFVEKEKIYTKEYIIDCKTTGFVEINKQTIIVNVTTYPARDMFLYEALLYFKKQTLKPTKIVLWLAKDEYDELNLPYTITRCIDSELLDNIIFVDKNIYCHKRHECFKYFNYAFNIFIDDDIYYPTTFVEALVYYSTLYHTPTSYFGKNMEYINTTWSANKFRNGPDIKNRYYGGLSCIPPYVFPLESFNYQNERDFICPKCDESWLQMWFIKNNIKVYCINEWEIGKSPFQLIEDTQKVSMWNENKQVKNNILKKVNNIARCIVFLNIEDKAKKLWPNFDIEKSCDGEYENIKKIAIK